MTATTHRFSVKDYYRMADAGLFPPGKRVELLEGEIKNMMPVGPFHSGVVNRLNRYFQSISNGRWLVTAQNPVRLSNYSEPQPDVVIVSPSADDYTLRHPRPEDVLLLVEVADTSLEYDEGEKLAAYGHAGIEEYWVVNLRDQCVQMHREPHYTGYARTTVLRAGEFASPATFPDVKVDIASLLHRPGKGAA